METGRFIIKASSDKILIRMTVAVKSTEACMDGSITKAQNMLWDTLRNLNFDANKIVIEPDNDLQP